MGQEKEIQNIPSGDHVCLVIDSKMIRSRNGRHGFLLKICIKGYSDQPFFHALWLGNYKNFREDTKRKHRIIWRLTSLSIGRLQTSFSSLKNNDSFGKIFLGHIRYRKIGGVDMPELQIKGGVL